MKKFCLSLFLSLNTINSYSQIIFEKGYFIDNENQRTICLIKNVDWRNNPTSFEYKMSENSDVQTANIQSTQEFRIDNFSKFVRSKVSIDRSSGSIKNLSDEREPVFEEATVFLKVLVEGEANLYEYIDGNLIRYFYSTQNSDIHQLVYKRYKAEGNSIGYNNKFRQQIWQNLKCKNFSIKKMEMLDYTKNDLKRIFTTYSNCTNTVVEDFEPNQKRDFFNLTIRPRLNSSSLSIENSVSSSKAVDFGNEIGFGVGVEAEFILPFNKDKWSVFVEPTYQSFNSTYSKPIRTGSLGVSSQEVNYTSIELPIGVRHYFFLNDLSKFFLNAAVIFDFNANSSINYSSTYDSSLASQYSLEIDSRNNFGFGVGYKYKDKYSIEMRYQTSREILGSYSFYSSDYNTISVILGYSFL